MLLLVACAGCPECFAPPAFLDSRRVSREEACSRIEAALRKKCDPALVFNCEAYFPAAGGCDGEQRESDVERCEKLIDRARECDEALNTVCGVNCDESPLPGR